MSERADNIMVTVIIAAFFVCFFYIFTLIAGMGNKINKPEHNCVYVYTSVFDTCVNRITNMNKDGNTAVCAVAAKQAADICTSSLLEVAK